MTNSLLSNNRSTSENVIIKRSQNELQVFNFKTIHSRLQQGKKIANYLKLQITSTHSVIINHVESKTSSHVRGKTKKNMTIFMTDVGKDV